MKKILKITIFTALISFFSVLLIVFGMFLYLEKEYSDKVMPNVFLEGEYVSGMNSDELVNTIDEMISKTNDELTIEYIGVEERVKTSEIGFAWDKNKTKENIYNLGKEDIFLKRFSSLVSSFVKKKIESLSFNFEEEVARQYLETISEKVDLELVESRFVVENNRVVDFELGSDGRSLLVEESVIVIKKALENKEDKAVLVVKDIKANEVGNINDMGISNIIATGESGFAGSPANRVHNISVGANVFDGILIAPGEEFSFIKYLGEVSAKTGYLPELVIKEDKTIPEYGGGLCQVSTTFFRAAINAGIPILERTPHAYRVAYYEPAGFDAAIYRPKPDLVFRNDTGKHILIKTRISGTQLFVDFYGTSDGRIVEVSETTVYNYVYPGEPIIVETTDLEPGEKKKIESAHIGASAYFTRKIIYSNGEEKEERFDSRYVPWREKFLVGVEKVEDNSEDSGEVID